MSKPKRDALDIILGTDERMMDKYGIDVHKEYDPYDLYDLEDEEDEE